MKIGCLSDTHKNIENLSSAIEFLKNSGTTTIVHLGDDYTDVDECGEENVVRVPGVFSDIYQRSDVPNRRIENFAGWRVLLTHTVSSHPNDLPGDIRPEQIIEDKRVDVVLHGHTHVPDIKREQGILFVNPGHLKDEDKKGYLPTFALLDFSEDTLFVTIYDLKTKSIVKKGIFNKGE